MPITTTPSGGPVGEYSTYTPIYSTTLSSTPSSVTFSNIPTTFTDLVLIISAKDSRVANSDSLTIQFNSDTNSNYSNTELLGNGTAASSTRSSSQTYMRIGDVGSASLSEYGTCVVHIMNYSNVNTFKTVLGRGNVAGDWVRAGVGLWRSTNPITSITILAQGGVATWTSGSTFTLYGIKAAAAAPKATGGDVVYTDNTYWYHVFNNSGIFDVKTAMNVDYLVVAGGGGGGYDAGGGGGAGGYLTSIGGSSLSVAAQVYAITVGAGGAGGTANLGSNGTNSVFSSITATGGGGGGSRTATYKTGATGGSAGGGSGDGGTGGTATASPSQGNNGGSGNASYTPGAGGGGAGAVGGNTTSENTAPSGGNGLANSISGSSVTYAGGGGGGYNATTANGGTGGGGRGGAGPQGGTSPTAGTTNLGGGGGGGSNSSYQINGAGGGSGVVIVRYAV